MAVWLDDQIALHRKVVRAGNAAFGAWVRMLAHSRAQLTDGVLLDEIARIYATKREIEKLLEVGLLERVEGGVRIHDFHEHNPTAAQVKAKREADAARKAASRSRRDRSEADAKPTRDQREADATARASRRDADESGERGAMLGAERESSTEIENVHADTPRPSERTCGGVLARARALTSPSPYPYPSPRTPQSPPDSTGDGTAPPSRAGRPELVAALAGCDAIAPKDLDGLARALDGIGANVGATPDRVVAAARQAALMAIADGVDSQRGVAWVRKVATRLMRTGELERELRGGVAERPDDPQPGKPPPIVKRAQTWG